MQPKYGYHAKKIEWLLKEDSGHTSEDKVATAFRRLKHLDYIDGYYWSPRNSKLDSLGIDFVISKGAWIKRVQVKSGNNNKRYRSSVMILTNIKDLTVNDIFKLMISVLPANPAPMLLSEDV